jgi:hypothetical protein
MDVPRPLFKGATRWIRALAWIGAWAAVVASSAFLPLRGSIALAVGVFAAQVLLPRRAATCHLPGGVTNGTSAGG